MAGKAAGTDRGPTKAAYTGLRPELLALVPTSARNVLDLGCATGELGAALKRERRGSVVTGIEIDAAMALKARSRLDHVLEGSIEPFEDIRNRLTTAPFDCIVCGDVLEHLVDPWSVLSSLRGQLSPGGSLVASIPNVGHIDTLANLLLRHRWPYRDRGIHDSTHLRFFAIRNVRALFEQAGFEIQSIRRSYRFTDRPHRINNLARALAWPGLRDLLTYQFLVVAVPGTRRPSRDAELTPRQSADA